MRGALIPIRILVSSSLLLLPHLLDLPSSLRRLLNLISSSAAVWLVLLSALSLSSVLAVCIFPHIVEENET